MSSYLNYMYIFSTLCAVLVMYLWCFVIHCFVTHYFVMVGCTDEAVCQGYKLLGSISYTDALPPRLSWCKWYHMMLSCSMLFLLLLGVHTLRRSGGGSVWFCASSFVTCNFSVDVTPGFKKLRHIWSNLSNP